MPQCSAIELGSRQNGQMQISLGSPKASSDGLFTVATLVRINCQNGADWTMTCVKCPNCMTPQWSLGELPDCEGGKIKFKNYLKLDKNGSCAFPELEENSLLVLDKKIVKKGEKVSFHCSQPNYVLSESTPRTCLSGNKIILKL